MIRSIYLFIDETIIFQLICVYYNHGEILVLDLESGVTLLILLEYLTGVQLKYHKQPKTNAQKLENLAIALDFMSAEGINLTSMCKLHKLLDFYLLTL